MRSWVQVAVVAALVAAVFAPSAAGSATADLASISADYGRHGKVTACRFTLGQLEAAQALIGADAQTYAPGLGDAIAREVKRWKDRACSGKRPSLKIVKISAKGPAREESVTIRNTGRKTINLRGYALRDAGDHTLKLRTTKLKPGAKLRIVTGCPKGHKSAFRRGTSYYTCRSKAVWDDAGDTVELLGAGGGLIATKTYGTPPAPPA